MGYKSKRSEINKQDDGYLNHILHVLDIETEETIQSIELGRTRIIDKFFIDLKQLSKYIEFLIDSNIEKERISILYNSEGLVYVEKGEIKTYNSKLLTSITTR